MRLLTGTAVQHKRLVLLRIAHLLAGQGVYSVVGTTAQRETAVLLHRSYNAA